MAGTTPQEMGAKGGHARAARLSPEERRRIAQAAAAARWSVPLATHSGVLNIGNAEIPCYVLEDGRRVLSTRGIMQGLKRRWRGRKHRGTQLPVFLEASNLKTFISEELDPVLSPIHFRTEKGTAAEGFSAEILPAVCEVYLRARDAKVLKGVQEGVALQCDLLMRALARVGIVALVDEATGYQYARARDALEKILEKYISEHLIQWAKRFPDEFYEQMFRLKGWDYLDPMKSRPGVVGKYTNDVVYDRLAPGVLEELRRLNPPNDRGYRRHRHHQWLTEDVGHPALRDHLMGVIALMKATPDGEWALFKRMLTRVYPRSKEQLEMLLEATR